MRPSENRMCTSGGGNTATRISKITSIRADNAIDPEEKWVRLT